MSAEADTKPPPRPRLSPQQSEVLAMLARGARTAQIAERLCIEQDTVRKYFRRIMERLNIEPESGEEARLVLMRWALENRGQWRVADKRGRTRWKR